LEDEGWVPVVFLEWKPRGGTFGFKVGKLPHIIHPTPGPVGVEG